MSAEKQHLCCIFFGPREGALASPLPYPPLAVFSQKKARKAYACLHFIKCVLRIFFDQKHPLNVPFKGGAIGALKRASAQVPKVPTEAPDFNPPVSYTLSYTLGIHNGILWYTSDIQWYTYSATVIYIFDYISIHKKRSSVYALTQHTQLKLFFWPKNDFKCSIRPWMAKKTS